MGGDHQADLMTKEQAIEGNEESQMIRDKVRPSREPEVAPDRQADKGTQAEKSGWERWMRASDLMEPREGEREMRGPVGLFLASTYPERLL